MKVSSYKYLGTLIDDKLVGGKHKSDYIKSTKMVIFIEEY